MLRIDVSSAPYAIPPDNPKHRPLQTVARIVAETQFTLATPGIDLTNHPLTDQAAHRALLNHSDKFVPEGPLNSRIPANYLKIRIADTRQRDTHQRLPACHRRRDITDFQLSCYKLKCFHFTILKAMTARFQVALPERNFGQIAPGRRSAYTGSIRV